jgi:hypothetical protein
MSSEHAAPAAPAHVIDKNLRPILTFRHHL